jgi:MFS family permease
MAWATGAIAQAAGLRPAPFLLGLAVAAIGLGLSAAAVRETDGHVAWEVAELAGSPSDDRGGLSTVQVVALTTWRDPTLAATSRAGLVNNLNEGMAWGLFPIFFAASGLTLSAVGLLTAVTPGVWALSQLATGALSDRIGRKWLIVGGQLAQAAGLVVIAAGTAMPLWVAGSVLLGAGTAMAYPTLIAAVGDVAHPSWRGTAVGVYRLWRDIGFAVGAILGGVLADRWSIPAAIIVVAGITAASGVDVGIRMRETHPLRAV